jgi:hypothetical protein
VSFTFLRSIKATPGRTTGCQHSEHSMAVKLQASTSHILPIAVTASKQANKRCCEDCPALTQLVGSPFQPTLYCPVAINCAHNQGGNATVVPPLDAAARGEPRCRLSCSNHDCRELLTQTLPRTLFRGHAAIVPPAYPACQHPSLQTR